MCLNGGMCFPSAFDDVLTHYSWIYHNNMKVKTLAAEAPFCCVRFPSLKFANLSYHVWFVFYTGPLCSSLPSLSTLGILRYPAVPLDRKRVAVPDMPYSSCFL